jgi:ribonucleoside-diphosphate reductase alpha chain
MHAADAVLSGGVRRSATICLFSPTDDEMAAAKTGNWYTDNPQRARSNNSAVIIRNEITREQFASLMTTIKQFGEPGFFFVDDRDITTNPCVEIGMWPQIDGKSGWQGCNLTEINGGMCDNEEIFYKACRAGAILGTLQAGYTDFKFLSNTSKMIFDREALLGVSITGWMNNPKTLFNEEILEKGAQIVRDTNTEVANLLGINPAARTTCVKPSGNASVLLMTASGIHADHAPMYIRNIQLNKDTEVAKLIKRFNPNMVEESVWSAGRTDYVVSFPVVANEGSLFKDDLIGLKHLDLIKKAQEHWVNAGTNVERCAHPGIRHNVSNTVIVDDWDEVEEYVFNNRDYFAGISFLSMSGDKDYNQAPNTQVLNSQQIVEKYGAGAIMAAGLIVEALKSFDNLWMACTTANGYGEDINADNHQNTLKKDWVRRFKKFATNYFDGDYKMTEYCFKDVYLLHKWEKIQQTVTDIKWEDELKEVKYIDVDTIGSAACVGGGCELF